MRDYTDDELKMIRATVGANANLAVARAEIASRLGVPEFTGDALQKLYKRRGWGAPTQSLAAGGGRMVDVSGLDYDDPVTTSPGVHPEVEAYMQDMTPDRQWVDAPELKRCKVPASGSSRWLFIPDTHVPYASRKAWLCMLAAARVWRPDGVVICGDFADCASVSFHDKSPHRPSKMAGEVDAVNAYLDEVDSIGAKHKLYASGYGFVDYLSTYQIGDCLITHTTEKFGGVLSHRKARDAFNASAVVGHCHRLSYETRGDYFGNVRAGMAIGCLFDFDTLDYEHKARAAAGWCHGFGIGTLDHAAGRMHLAPVPIVDGSCSIMGEIVRAAA